MNTVLQYQHSQVPFWLQPLVGQYRVSKYTWTQMNVGGQLRRRGNTGEMHIRMDCPVVLHGTEEVPWRVTRDGAPVRN
jgi:hypothetical protein